MKTILATWMIAPAYVPPLPAGWTLRTLALGQPVGTVPLDAKLVIAGWSEACGERGLRGVLRGMLAEGRCPDAVIALDGVSASWPHASDLQMEPWEALVKRARAGRCMFALTATQQTYTEALRLPEHDPFASTVRIASALWDTRLALLAELGELLGPGVHDDGDFHVEIHKSARIDGPAHVREVREHFARIMRELVIPHIEGDAPPPTPRGDGFSFDAAGDGMPRLALPEIGDTLRPSDDGPAVTRLQALLDAVGSDPTIGPGHTTYGPATTRSVRHARVAFGFPAADDAPADFVAALERAVAELPKPAASPALSPLRAAIVAAVRSHVGTREDPPGSNIVPFAPTTVRGGKWIRVQGQAWCARFVSEIVWKAYALAGYADMWNATSANANHANPPFGLRAAVSELCADAKQTGALHKMADAAIVSPRPGDLAIYGRGGQNPLTGGLGHVGIVTAWPLPKTPGALDGSIVSGNDGDQVREGPLDRSAKGEPLLAWIEVERA